MQTLLRSSTLADYETATLATSRPTTGATARPTCSAGATATRPTTGARASARASVATARAATARAATAGSTGATAITTATDIATARAGAATVTAAIAASGRGTGCGCGSRRRLGATRSGAGWGSVLLDEVAELLLLRVGQHPREIAQGFVVRFLERIALAAENLLRLVLLRRGQLELLEQRLDFAAKGMWARFVVRAAGVIVIAGRQTGLHRGWLRPDWPVRDQAHTSNKNGGA